jgi:hypothetical protein
MSEKYNPEIGQAVFGCPVSEFACPDDFFEIIDTCICSVRKKDLKVF